MNVTVNWIIPTSK